VGVEGTYLNIIKALYEKQLTYSSEKLSFFLRTGIRQRCPLITFIQHHIRSPSHSNQTRKRKDTQIGKEEVKLSLFADNIKYFT